MALAAAVAMHGALVPANDPAFRYSGRIDDRHPEVPVIVWESTRVAADFRGPDLTLRFGPAAGQNFFNLAVDGTVDVIAVRAGAASALAYGHPLSSGLHHLVLVKRSEAAAGSAAFVGIEVRDAPSVRLPAAGPSGPRFQFFGDSITAGACNEDGPADQWEDRRTHDAEQSYAALTAREFGADYRIMAVSGIGIVTGYVPPTFGQVWDRLYPEAASPAADLAAWKPDVIFFNLGENDASFSAKQGRPFPSDFAARYQDLVRRVRAAYPGDHFVLLRGGMGEGATNADLIRAWTTAMQMIEAADPAVSHFTFAHWSKQHPRVADDRAMAAELTSWLRRQPFAAQPRRP